jgi:dTDP-4-dehydrorhamnose reductase
MLRLGRERESLSIVDDQIGAPTTSIELARATHAIVSGLIAGRYASPQSCYGLYHMSCSGSTSWFGFAQAIFARATQLLGVKPPELKPIASSDYKTHATRPQNSVLSNEKLHTRFGIQLQPWESALDEVMQVLRSESPQQ